MEDNSAYRERGLTPEVIQINVSNPAEFVADAVLHNGAILGYSERAAESAIININSWARGTEMMRNEGDRLTEDGHNLLSLKALWEHPDWKGDYRPFTHVTRGKTYTDLSGRFPRQGMLSILESMTGKKIGYAEAAPPDKVNEVYIGRLRELFGDKLIESKGEDRLGYEYTSYSVPTISEGIMLRIIIGGRYAYDRTEKYPAFNDMVLEFDRSTLGRVKPFSDEFRGRVGERFGWYKEGYDKRNGERGRSERTSNKDSEAGEKNYNPLKDVPLENHVAMAQAMRDLGIEDMKFGDIFEFRNRVKKQYRKMAKELHPDVNPEGGQRMRQVNNANDLIEGLFKDKWKEKDDNK